MTNTECIEKIKTYPHFVVAVDGPSSAGKSTVAKRIAELLGIDYIDTGAMYRAIALKILNENIDIPDEITQATTDQLKEMLDRTTVDLKDGLVLLDDNDVSGLIRTPEVTMMASKSSALQIIREKLVALQRIMGEKKSVIMDGRDIGSNVFPNADYKFYVIASSEVRANRRYKEMLEKGMDVNYDDVLADIEKRDYDDSHRAINPLCKTDDAIEVDTDNMEIEEVVSCMLEAISE